MYACVYVRMYANVCILCAYDWTNGYVCLHIFLGIQICLDVVYETLSCPLLCRISMMHSQMFLTFFAVFSVATK